jgi:hypothetical protein
MVAAITIASGFTLVSGCRQLLGVNDSEDAGASASDDGGAEAESGASTFEIMNVTPAGAALNGITGFDAEHWIAVGNDGVSYVYTAGDLKRLGGSTPGRNYFGVWGSSPSDVFAVGTTGNTGFIDHFDGSAWTQVFDSPTSLYSVWGAGGGVVLAVGEQGLMYGIKPKDVWKKVQTISPNPDLDASVGPTLWGISGRNFNDFCIAGDVDYFLHTEQQQFVYYEPVSEHARFHTVFQVPGNATNVIFGTNHWGVYWFTAPNAAHTDASIIPAGSGFSLTKLYRDEATPGHADKYIQGLWATTSKVVAVGDDARVLVTDLGLDETTTLPMPTDAALGGVWGSSTSDVWIVGDRELVLHGSLP